MGNGGNGAAAHAARTRRLRYGAAGGTALAVGAFTGLAMTAGPATSGAPASSAAPAEAGIVPSATPAVDAGVDRDQAGFLPAQAGGAASAGAGGPAVGASHAS